MMICLIQHVIRAWWQKYVMQKNKLEIWAFVLPKSCEKKNKASWLWWFGGFIWKLKVICSILEVIWTNGRYRAALSAKKQIGKPGRSQISPNYTWPQAIIRLFPILCIYSTSRDVLMSYHDECQCGCESSKPIQSRQVINQQIAGRVRGTLLPQITNI